MAICKTEAEVAAEPAMRYSVDMFPLSEAEALGLMIYHLRMAAVLFETVNEDAEQVVDEFERVLGPAAGPKASPRNAPARLAAGSFYATLCVYYEELAKAQGS